MWVTFALSWWTVTCTTQKGRLAVSGRLIWACPTTDCTIICCYLGRGTMPTDWYGNCIFYQLGPWRWRLHHSGKWTSMEIIMELITIWLAQRILTASRYHMFHAQGSWTLTVQIRFFGYQQIVWMRSSSSSPPCDWAKLGYPFRWLATRFYSSRCTSGHNSCWCGRTR